MRHACIHTYINRIHAQTHATLCTYMYIYKPHIHIIAKNLRRAPMLLLRGGWRTDSTRARETWTRFLFRLCMCVYVSLYVNLYRCDGHETWTRFLFGLCNRVYAYAYMHLHIVKPRFDARYASVCVSVCMYRLNSGT
jgi:hypothetical protein